MINPEEVARLAISKYSPDYCVFVRRESDEQLHAVVTDAGELIYDTIFFNITHEGDRWTFAGSDDGVQITNISEQWTVKESAEYLCVELSIVYWMVQQCLLEGIPLGGRWRIRRSSVFKMKEWIDRDPNYIERLVPNKELDTQT